MLGKKGLQISSPGKGSFAVRGTGPQLAQSHKEVHDLASQGFFLLFGALAGFFGILPVGLGFAVEELGLLAVVLHGFCINCFVIHILISHL